MTNYRERQIIGHIDDADLTSDTRAVFEHIVETRKLEFLPNMFAVMGHSPGALEAVAAVGEHVRFKCSLDESIRELIICQVSGIIGNKYEWRHHISKVPKHLRSLLCTLEIEQQPDPVGSVLQFARRIVMHEEVSSALMKKLELLLGRPGLVDVTVMVGYYQLLGNFCKVMGIAVEDEVPLASVSLENRKLRI